jgi:hypothetical protein
LPCLGDAEKDQDKNSVTREGNTPLSYAEKYQRSEIVQLIKQHLAIQEKSQAQKCIKVENTAPRTSARPKRAQVKSEVKKLSKILDLCEKKVDNIENVYLWDSEM